MALMEAMLFTTSRPLGLEEIRKNLKLRVTIVEKMLDEIEKKYASEHSGIHLSRTNGFRLIVKPDYLHSVAHLTPHADMSRGLLRVLGIIVYYEPIKQSDIVKIIGNRTYDYVKDLSGRGLIKTEKKSRTILLSTTPKFEEYFGVSKEEVKKMLAGDKNGNDRSGHEAVPDGETTKISQN